MKHSCNQSNCAAVIVLLSFPRQNRLYALTAVHLQKPQHFDSCTAVREQQSPRCKSSLVEEVLALRKGNQLLQPQSAFLIFFTFIDLQDERGPSPQLGASAG